METLDWNWTASFGELSRLKVKQLGVIVTKNREQRWAVQFPELDGGPAVLLGPGAPGQRRCCFLFPDDNTIILHCKLAAEADSAAQQKGIHVVNLVAGNRSETSCGDAARKKEIDQTANSASAVHAIYQGPAGRPRPDTPRKIGIDDCGEQVMVAGSRQGNPMFLKNCHKLAQKRQPKRRELLRFDEANVSNDLQNQVCQDAVMQPLSQKVGNKIGEMEISDIVGRAQLGHIERVDDAARKLLNKTFW